MEKTQKPLILKLGDIVEVRFNHSAWATCKIDLVSSNQNSIALRLLDSESLPWVHGFIHTEGLYRMFLLMRHGGRYFDIASGNEFEIRKNRHEGH